MTEGGLHRRLPAKHWDELKRPRCHAAGLGVGDGLRFSWHIQTGRIAACGRGARYLGMEARCVMTPPSRRLSLLAMLVVGAPAVCLLLACAAPTTAQDLTRPEHRWLRGQQYAKTGLLRSYDIPGNRAAWTYDQALAILAFLEVDDTRAATRCANGMLTVRDGNLGVWADGYDVATGSVTAKPVAAGPNAWMGLAMLALHGKTREEKYLKASVSVADFLLRLQIAEGKPAGVIAGGFDGKGKPLPWAATEHNADAVAFLAQLADVARQDRYREAAIRAAKWLNREMWDEKLGCYLPGYHNIGKATRSDFPERLDSQTWTILAFHAAAQSPNWPPDAPKAHNGLPWIAKYQCRLTHRGQTVTGFAKITLGEWAIPSVWTEGTAGYILAGRILGDDDARLAALLSSLRALQQKDGAVPYSVGTSFPDVAKQFNGADIVVAHFEGHPNALFGNVGVYGDAEPDWPAIEKAGRKQPYSWYYDPDVPGYDKTNVHSGRQSFRLVSAGAMCKSRGKRWASLALDLSPVVDGKVTSPVDITACRALAFWARTDAKGGAVIEVSLRDASRRDGSFGALQAGGRARVTGKWERHTIGLAPLRDKVSLNRLAQVTFEFGRGVGNPNGTVLYVDDVYFVASKPVAGPGPKPAVYPQHWPFDSVAGTAWLVFVECETNPFDVSQKQPTTKRDPR